MTSTTVETRVYDIRLPAPNVVRGVLAVRDPSCFDIAVLASGYVLTAETFDLPPAVDDSGDVDGSRLIVRGVVHASAIRAYVLLVDGWWRIDVGMVGEPARSDVVGELTPLPDMRSFLAIQTTELRVDDLVYVSGLPGGCTSVRVLDVIFRSDDGRGPYALVRTVYGWFLWRRPFIHVDRL